MSEPNKEISDTKEPSAILDYATPRPKALSEHSGVWVLIAVVLIFAFLTAIILPALNPARSPGIRPSCGANLHQLVTNLVRLAQQNGGQFPDSLETMILSGAISPQLAAKILVCPQSIDTPAPGTTAQQVAANLHLLGRPMQFLNTMNPPPLHVSYIYLGKGLTSGIGGRKVLLFEPPEHHAIGKDLSINAAWTDGSVHTYTLDAPTMQKLMSEFQSGQNPPATLKKLEGLP